MASPHVASMAFFAEKPAKTLDKSSLVEPVVTGTNIKQVGTHFLSRWSSDGGLISRAFVPHPAGGMLALVERAPHSIYLLGGGAYGRAPKGPYQSSPLSGPCTRKRKPLRVLAFLKAYLISIKHSDSRTRLGQILY